MTRDSAFELNNPQAERALIGSVLIDPAAYRRVRHVPPDAFSSWKEKTVWEAVERLVEDGKPLDYIILCDILERDGHLEDMGGSAYVAGLANAVPSALRVEEYADVVLDYARRREDVRLAERLAALAMNGESDPGERATIAHRILQSDFGERGLVEAYDAARAALAQIERYIENPIDYGEIRDLSTGLMDLDRITGGLHQGLYAVAGSTSAGKTALALTVAVNIAVNGRRVMFVSPEMSPADLMHRIICAFAQIDSRALERGKMTPAEMERVYDVLGWASEMDLTISQEERIPTIEAQVHRMLPLDLVVLDGIELLRGGTKEKTHELRGELSRWAKGIADHPDVQCPVWLSMQVTTKELKGRGDKMPRMGDIYGSSEPEFITDNLITVARPDVFKDDPKEHTHLLHVAYLKSRKRQRGLPASCQFFLDRYGQVKDVETHQEPPVFDAWMD